MNRRNTGMGGLFSAVGSVAVIGMLIYASIIGAIIYVAWHFVSKWW